MTLFCTRKHINWKSLFLFIITYWNEKGCHRCFVSLAFLFLPIWDPNSVIFTPQFHENHVWARAHVLQATIGVRRAHERELGGCYRQFSPRHVAGAIGKASTVICCNDKLRPNFCQNREYDLKNGSTETVQDRRNIIFLSSFLGSWQQILVDDLWFFILTLTQESVFEQGQKVDMARVEKVVSVQANLKLRNQR